MRIAYVSGAFVLAVILTSIAIGAEPGDPSDERNWLNEKTWPAFVASRRLEITGTDSGVAKFRKERFNAGQQELRDRYAFWLQGEESLPQVYDTARRVVEARMEAGGPQSGKAVILREKVAFAKVVEKQAEQLLRKFNKVRQGADIPTATYYRAAAELELLQAETTSAEKTAPGVAGTKTSRLDFQMLSGGPSLAVISRAKVPGGWLITMAGMRDNPGLAITFYPDPDHKWNGGSLP
jgi:hypothetical protein